MRKSLTNVCTNIVTERLPKKPLTTGVQQFRADTTDEKVSNLKVEVRLHHSGTVTPRTEYTATRSESKFAGKEAAIAQADWQNVRSTGKRWPEAEVFLA